MAIERTNGSSSSLIDVLDHVLDKGIVIDVGPLVGADLHSLDGQITVTARDDGHVQRRPVA